MRDIKGYEGLYAITSCGRVWSYYSNKFVSQRYNKDGYKLVNLHKNGKQRTFSVHRLVAEAYIPNPLGLPDINHKNEQKDCNYLNNLEWMAHSDNVKYGTGIERSAAKRCKKVYCVELDKTFDSIKQAGEELNICKDNICKCVKGKYKTAGKYHWRYADGKED